jgi:uncharacterized protein YqkB
MGDKKIRRKTGEKMNVTFTNKAVEKLQNVLVENKGKLQLKYDTEGCGCVVNGVAMLVISNKVEEDDVKVETNYKPIHLQKEAIVFWDEELTIDYVEKYNCFQLKSPAQVLNPRMSLINESRTV